MLVPVSLKLENGVCSLPWRCTSPQAPVEIYSSSSLICLLSPMIFLIPAFPRICGMVYILSWGLGHWKTHLVPFKNVKQHFGPKSLFRTLGKNVTTDKCYEVKNMDWLIPILIKLHLWELRSSFRCLSSINSQEKFLHLGKFWFIKCRKNPAGIPTDGLRCVQAANPAIFPELGSKPWKLNLDINKFCK